MNKKKRKKFQAGILYVRINSIMAVHIGKITTKIMFIQWLSIRRVEYWQKFCLKIEAKGMFCFDSHNYGV